MMVVLLSNPVRPEVNTTDVRGVNVVSRIHRGGMSVSRSSFDLPAAIRRATFLVIAALVTGCASVTKLEYEPLVHDLGRQERT